MALIIVIRRSHCRYFSKIGMGVIFFGLLSVFWIAVISLGYIAIYRLQDFVNMKPFEPNERYPFMHKSGKLPMCENYEYFTDFQPDKPLKNIWITLIWSIIDVVVSISTLYGIVMENPSWLDSGIFYLFLYAVHKGVVAGILFLIRCPKVFLLQFFVLTEPLVALLSFLEVAVSVKLIHLILMAVAIFLLTLVTILKNNVVERNLKKKSRSIQSNMRHFEPLKN